MKAVTYFINEKTKDRIIQINISRISKSKKAFDELKATMINNAKSSKQKEKNN
ncbi:MAG: hypothetical protein HY252_17130 [Sphingobacteriales bacterium]|nr:hypothetical protein [Sphingobacteriales bacterium]